jgi:ferric-dicitrate binding protein FerR (iron transport regulator)
LTLKNYGDYQAEDFLQDEHFREWMACGAREDSSFWKNVKEQFPDKINDLRLAQGIYSSLHSLQVVPAVDVKAGIWNNVEQSIEALDDESGANRSVYHLYRWWWMAAASLLIVGGLAWSLRSTYIIIPLDYKRQVSSATGLLKEKINTTEKDQIVLLKDGSTVRLTPGSKLSYSDFSESERIVYLDGEGYFDVTKNPDAPFFVYAGQIVVQVVGTSFKVVSSTGQTQSNVAVTSGKVRVFSAGRVQNLDDQNPEQAIYLTANEQVVFDATKSSFEKGLVAEPVQVVRSGRAREFYFTNTSVSDILKELETAYGVRMRYHNASLESCKVTAPLGDLPLFRKLDILCQTIGATYEVFGNEIIISGGSCDL